MASPLRGLLCLLLCLVATGEDCHPLPDDAAVMRCADGRVYRLAPDPHEPVHGHHGPNASAGANASLVECERINAHTLECGGTEFENEELVRPPDPRFYMYAGIVVTLIVVAGLMSGLQLGLLALEEATLLVLIKAGEREEEKPEPVDPAALKTRTDVIVISKNAKRILPLVQRRHLLMVTLLVGNAGCLEALPLFLDPLMDPFFVILLSVTAVLFFGEIIPQSICIRYGLSIGARLSPMVWCLVYLTYPISWPISKILDALLGHEHTHFFNRGQLQAFIELQHLEGTGETKLMQDEALIISGALEMTGKTVQTCMTNLEDVFMLDQNVLLNKQTLQKIQQVGKSRILIYNKDRMNVVGVLLATDLLGQGWGREGNGDPIHIHQFKVRKLHAFYAHRTLYECLHDFANGELGHIATVHGTRDPRQVIGIVTLHDVCEVLILTLIETWY